ncbi:hypothetical protein GCM10009836_39170 [Pseudonocardia ailaonensis]|uniref:Secreted protein n=1 Tax=Pseudonocardia ailaonensis TaxID=367279 RepID=A0ABN2N939_9PSEU
MLHVLVVVCPVLVGVRGVAVGVLVGVGAHGQEGRAPHAYWEEFGHCPHNIPVAVFLQVRSISRRRREAVPHRWRA